MFSILPGQGRIGAWRDRLANDDVDFIREQVEAAGLPWAQMAWEPQDTSVAMSAA
jgi:hypothetical protein